MVFLLTLILIVLFLMTAVLQGCVTSSQMGALPFEKKGKVVIPEVHEIRYRVGFETDKMVKEAQEAIRNELS